MQDLNESYKIIFVGDSGAGKTSIINAYFDISSAKSPSDPNSSPNIPAPTIGASQLTIYHKKIVLRIWDTAGQENYRAILPLYFKNSSLAIIVFDISNRTSFEHLTKNSKSKSNSTQNSENNNDNNNSNKKGLYETGSWLDLVAQYAPQECKMIIVGNKSDLKDKRQVSIQEGETLVRKINSFWKDETYEKAMFYIETSIINNSNIYELFDQIFESKDCLMKKYLSQELLPTIDDKLKSDPEQNNNKSNGCC